MHRSLTHKTAVVTGSSSGIGQATAIALAGAGAAVVVHGHSNLAGAEQTAAECEKLGVATQVILADLTERAEQERLVNAAWNWRGTIDIWINNAGADCLTGAAAQLSFEEKLALLWQLDVTATVQLTRLVARRMQAVNAASTGSEYSITNLGWDQAATGMEGDSGEMFATVKGAVMAFTRSAAKSYAPLVRVNCVAPGWIQTAWGEEASPYWEQRARREALLGRWGSPEDVAAAMVFLASPAASFVTGQVLNVNGGFRGSAEPEQGDY